MAILRAAGLTKYFGERTLFSDVSFELFPGDRVGFVGVNGCGKSTLLRMLDGRESIDKGQLSIAKDCKIASLDQTIPPAGENTLYQTVLDVFSPLLEMETQLAGVANDIERGDGNLERLVAKQCRLQEAYETQGGLTFRTRTRATLLGLGFSEEDLEKRLHLMSGGEIRKALLSRLLLSDANLLLLDEPTNHLDIGAVEWLEEYLRGCKSAFIVISHDRYFLDHVTERTMELENGALKIARGNYSRYTELKMDAREILQRQYLNKQREIKRIEGIIEQQRRWNQERNYVTIASKEKQIARLRQELVKPDPLPENLRFSFRAVEGSGNDVLIGKRLKKSFGSETLFRNVDLHILKNERVCLIGANGCGKTTLLRILTGRAVPDEGTFAIGANVQVGYYEQSLTGFRPENSILNELWDAFPRLDQQTLRNTLGQFMFHGDDVMKKMSALSGGELARVQLLKLMLAGSNFLLLDEPTNHLDIASREALERALSDYGGTMLIVTHDRYFVNRLADRIVILGKNGITEFSGDWDAYKQFLAQEAEPEEVADATSEPVRENAYLKSKELRAQKAKCKGDRDRAEARIAELEAKAAALETTLNAPENASDYEKSSALYAELDQLKNTLETAYAAWEQAEERYDALRREEES